MKRKIILLFVSVLFPALCFAAESANYKTNTFSIDGGGGKSAGTSYKTVVNFGVGSLKECGCKMTHIKGIVVFQAVRLF